MVKTHCFYEKDLEKKKKVGCYRRSLSTAGRNKSLIDPVISPVRTWLMLGDVNMDTASLPLLQLWVLDQGVVNEAWPYLEPILEPAAFSSALCCLVPILLLMSWAGPLCWKLNWRLLVGLQPSFFWGKAQGDFMERMSLDSYQITLLLTFRRLEFQALEVQRQFTDTRCWPSS